MYKKSAEAPIPVYYKLQKSLRDEIEKGIWGPGESIPPERKLAEIHQVSIGTVKKALLNLVNEGYLSRVQGKGTFVSGTMLRRQNLRYYRLLKDFRDEQVQLDVNVIEIKKTAGSEFHNRYLKIRRNQDLYEIRRLFSVAKKPIIYSLSYLPRKMLPGLDELPPKAFEKSLLFEMLEDKYGLTTVYNQKLFGAEAADKETAELLEIKAGMPILTVEMLSFTYADKPYEYRKSYCLSNERKIFVEI
ncbi:MAG: GntR family transcriptional regulator [Deltaproteobacteria bacterium]|nr:GntR family transcriptional regulator [Deltaproteobacteria bacterium]